MGADGERKINTSRYPISTRAYICDKVHFSRKMRHNRAEEGKNKTQTRRLNHRLCKKAPNRAKRPYSKFASTKPILQQKGFVKNEDVRNALSVNTWQANWIVRK